jgi:hypothetical protein
VDDADVGGVCQQALLVLEVGDELAAPVRDRVVAAGRQAGEGQAFQDRHDLSPVGGDRKIFHIGKYVQGDCSARSGN